MTTITSAIIAIILVAPCAAKNEERIDVTDLAGRAVNVPVNPKRIVCVCSGCLRLICYLGAQDRVVGVEAFENRKKLGRPYRYANPDLVKLPIIGPGGPQSINKEPDLEAMLKVKPEVIFITYIDKAKAEALQKKLGIPVVVLTYGRFATFDPVVFESLRLAGKILGKQERAEQIMKFVEDAKKDLARRVGSVEDSVKPRVYVGAVGYKGAQGIVSTEPLYLPLDWVKGNNLAKKLSGTEHVFIDNEKLLSWNPDLIFIDGMGLGVVEREYAKNRRFLEGLKAFQDRKVFLLFPFNWYVTNIGTTIVDAYAVGKVLYPKQFTDIEIPAKADEVYRFFVGKPVYAEMERDFGKLGDVVRFLKIQ